LTHEPTQPDVFAAAPQDVRELLELARELAREAGRLHAEGRTEGLRLQTKSSPTDLVSQIDQRVEALIADRLRAERPGDALLAEEGSLAEGTSGVRWVVDPLDGTTSYVYDYPCFAVSIGVEVDGEAAVGVVLDSATGRLFSAVKGFGAECDGRSIRAREPQGLARALVATGFSYDAAQRVRQGAVLAAVLPRVRDIRRGGAAAVDLTHVASGRVDAYYELDLSPWDYTAGVLIAREAGAAVELRPAAHGRSPAVVAAHPALIEDVIALLTDAGALA
jgi:myo-inositol-1(or 4)-monophosphatase